MRGRTVRFGDLDHFVAESGTGVPVLMLSGLGYANWCWKELMAQLSPSWNTIALDNIGSGRSDKPAGPYSITSFADDAAGALRALGLPSAHVIGNSMGGYIALTMAIRHPHLVRSLVLSNTTQGGEGMTPVPAPTLDAWKAASGLAPREFARRTMAFSYPPGWAEANAERFAAILERRLEFPTPAVCWAAQYDACARFLLEGLDVSPITQPALVIHGTQDRVVPYENGPRLAKALRRGELRTLEGRGHVPFLEALEEFADIVRPFLRAHE